MNKLQGIDKQLIRSIQLGQLQVLIESGIVQFPVINVNEISSPQQLLIHFYQYEQTIKSKNNRKQHESLHHKLQQTQDNMQQLCRKLLNDEFMHYHHHHHQQSINTNNKQSLSTQDRQQQQHQQQQQQFQTNEQVYFQESILLTQQTLTKIQSYCPFSIQLINTNNVTKFSFPHCEKLLNLIDIEINNYNDNNKNKKDQNNIQTLLSPQQLVYIVQQIILPIAFLHGANNNGDTLFKCVQQIKQIMNYFIDIDRIQQSKTVISQLSEAITKFYLNKCQQQQESKGNYKLSIHSIIAMMTIIQAIHSTSQTYHPLLLSSTNFIQHINLMLRCSNVDSKTANSIAVNIYGALLKQKNLYSTQAQIFINLYSTLRCFGAHLVKDVWTVFYDFIEMEGNDTILAKAQLLDIIFYKIQHHQNANVVKHCIQSILQQQRSYILFQKVPDAIYNSLMRILNYGMHYLDCLFHMDSKMFLMISEFFAGYFNNPAICKDEDVQRHMRLFLKAISEKISFDHALVSMLHSFTLIIRKSHTIDQQILQLITRMIKKYYVKNPIRKRHQMMNGVTYLLKNHLLTVEKTKHLNFSTQQKAFDDNSKAVSLQYLINQCLCYFPEQYVTLKYNDRLKRQEIQSIIEENFSNQQFNNTIKNYALKIIDELKTKNTLKIQYFNHIIKSLSSIELILYISQQQTINLNQIRCKFQSLSTQVIQVLRQMYSRLYEKFVVDLGDSLYKGQYQRLCGILIQKQCLSKIFSIKLFNHTFSLYQFSEKSLTNVSYFIKNSFQQNNPISNQQLTSCKYIVGKCFQMIYSQTQSKELQQKLPKVGSQFMQWATDHLQNKQCQLLVLQVLKCRIRLQSNFDIDYIEESVYQIFWSIFDLQYQKKTNKSENPLSEKSNNTLSEKVTHINPLLRLRLFTLSGNILFNDQSEVKKFIPSILSNIDQIADRYDFQNLDQVFNFIQNVFTCQQSLLADKESYDKVYNNECQQTYTNISKIIWSVIENMLASLNYGVDTKEVIACTDSVLNILFNYAQKYRTFNPQLVKLALKVISIGEEYWMFERVMAFNVIKKLEKLLTKHKDVDFKELFPLLSRILCIEQYRGYDSAIALQPYLSKRQFYTQLKLTLNKEADYQGVTCRLALVSFVNSLVECSVNNRQNHHKNEQIERFLLQFFMHLFEMVRKDLGEKMFMTGEHKVKIKHWQCIMAYDNEWLYWALNQQQHHNKEKNLDDQNLSLDNLILSLITMVDLNNNLAEVKYYIQLFLMKLLINKHSLHIITPEILSTLSERLLDLISQVNKNTSFIVISGMLVNYLFKTYQIKKGHVLFEKLQKLYNALLTYSCSHVAYFRGLSQYFCLETVFIESPYIRILNQTIGLDPDTIIMRDKLNVIMNDYFTEIYNWTVTKNLFKQLPSLNRNIISDTFYMDRIKKLGQQLLREIKGELGFLPYKDIWIEAVKTLKLTEQNNNKNQEAEQSNSQQAIFQRKIDPSLDFIYFSKTKLEGFDMKILITGSKAIPIYGHLSRTGQIFGLSQLILPYKEIIQDEEFKNVACTAEKWLNISEFSNQRQIKDKQKFSLSLEKRLIKIKEEDYSLFLLKKHQNLSNELLKKQLSEIQSHKKILLILDSQNYLPSSINSLLTGVICFGRYFSEHVQASIFIWQYFKEVYGRKFRAQEIQTC